VTHVADLWGFAVAIPLSVGLPQWERSGVARSYAALPMVTLGLGLPLAASVARGRRKLGLLMASLLIPIGTLLILTPLLYVTGLVMAWWHNQDPVERFGLKNGVVTLDGVRALFYPLLYLWMGLKAVAWAHGPKELGPTPK
jgi:hypothetical protein